MRLSIFSALLAVAALSRGVLAQGSGTEEAATSAAPAPALLTLDDSNYTHYVATSEYLLVEVCVCSLPLPSPP
jgi:hypothetical protein